MVLNPEGWYEPESSMPPYNCHLIGGPADGQVLVMADTPLDIKWRPTSSSPESIYRYSGRRDEDCHPIYRFLETE
jgi:hypothetical protein